MSAFSHQRPVHATEDEEEQLSTFTNYGYEQFTNTWIGQPPVNFGAPRNHYDIQKMRDFYDYMASGRESDPTTGDRFQYVVVHDEAITASNQRTQAGQFSIKRDYDSALAIRRPFRSRRPMWSSTQSQTSKKACRETAESCIYEAVRQAHAETYPENYHGYAASFDVEMARAPNNSLQLLLAQYGVPDFMEVFQTVLKAACPWAVTVEEEKKTHNGYSTHLYPAGKKPTQMIRILITADKPPPTRETKPVLDAQKLEQYIENNVLEDNHVAPVTAETILVQHTNRLQITAAQQEQLMRRPPGTRVPAYINIWEEEEESSGEENN
ncbi:hypothetical protein C8J57DRAFT_1227919 [Mycena rebaudengoi]|nr:hypothetical protein C8J57DRAFT_1227919 [Mycena rebaudengoi]